MPTATKKQTEPVEVVEYDFDSWSEEDEEKAIAALVPQIKHIIVEKTFVGRFPDGVIVKLPLSISLDDIDAMSETTPNPVDQVKELLNRMGGPEALAEFTRHDLAETIVMAERFFQVFTRIAGASFPES
jgi:hypothetical protein